MSAKILDTIGIITKKESFVSVEHETGSNAMILESMQPYPGYHGLTVPDSLEPDSLFAITKLMYDDEKIIRAIQTVKKNFKGKFDATPGTINIQNLDNNFIRFKHLAYARAGEVIQEFEKAGIEFKKKKTFQPFESILKVRKFFTVEETTEGIFKDLTDTNMFYIRIPVALSWANFEKITLSLKYNMDDKNFDAAQCSVFYRHGLIDFVRIYDRDCCQGKLIFIRDKYLEAISKL
ncbi:MAG TPA: hypothetical protein VIN10_01655 [Bacteroidales bacterium]